MARRFVPADATNPPLVAICYQRCLLHTPGERRREHDQPSPVICLTLSRSGTSLAGNNVQKIPPHRPPNRSSEKTGPRLAFPPQPLSSFSFPFPPGSLAGNASQLSPLAFVASCHPPTGTRTARSSHRFNTLPHRYHASHRHAQAHTGACTGASTPNKEGVSLSFTPCLGNAR